VRKRVLRKPAFLSKGPEAFRQIEAYLNDLVFFVSELEELLRTGYFPACSLEALTFAWFHASPPSLSYLPNRRRHSSMTRVGVFPVVLAKNSPTTIASASIR